MRLATTACYRACTATDLADATTTTTTTATTTTTHATSTATELADAKTIATEHCFCLIGVGACAQILISEPEREALTQKKPCVTTAMHPQQHTMAAPWQVPQTASPHEHLACVA